VRSTSGCWTLKRVGQGTVLASPAFARIAQPTVTDDGSRAPALRFGDPRVQALAGALANLLFAVAAITNKRLRALTTGLLGTPYSLNQASYDLARLRRNGLVARVPGHNCYTLTPTASGSRSSTPRSTTASSDRCSPPGPSPTRHPSYAPRSTRSSTRSTNASPHPATHRSLTATLQTHDKRRNRPTKGSLAALGAGRDPFGRVYRPPGEATLRRVVARVDPDVLDLVIGRWLADQQPPKPRAGRRALAVDGKTLCGSGHQSDPQVHLLAVMDHSSRTVLAQTEVDYATNEIARFRPLLDRPDLAATVVTADALHTQREHADWLVTHKHAAYLLIVKANQSTLHQQLKALPWREVPVADRTRNRGHGRAETRRSACTSVRRMRTAPRADPSPLLACTASRGAPRSGGAGTGVG